MNDDIRDCVRKRASGGFSLVEVMITVVIIGILAGCTTLAISRGSDNAEAAVVMSDLDAAKNALLAYSMEHRTRTSDRLNEFIGANPSVIIRSLDNYMSSQIMTPGSKAQVRFNVISVDIGPSGAVRIGFDDFPAEKSLAKALERKTAAAHSNAVYQVTSSDTTCSIWLNVK
ncbi:MAG: type II secretion system GspH family protein [Synergistaceae bacterium]|nr:type II secretion system GspH family protein [Synergistaceae bacterium]